MYHMSARVQSITPDVELRRSWDWLRRAIWLDPNSTSNPLNVTGISSKLANKPIGLRLKVDLSGLTSVGYYLLLHYLPFVYVWCMFGCILWQTLVLCESSFFDMLVDLYVFTDLI